MAATREELTEKRKKLYGEIVSRRDAFHANGKSWKDGEERSAWDKVNADYNAVVKSIEEIDTADSVDKRLAEVKDLEERTTVVKDKPGMDDFDPTAPEDRSREERHERRHKVRLPDEEQRALAMAGFCRAKMGHEVRDDHLAAMRECRMSPYGDGILFGQSNSRFHTQLKREWNSGHQSTAINRCLESRALSSITSGIGGALVPDSFLRTLEVNQLAWGGLLAQCTTLTTADGGELTLLTGDDTANIGRRIGENAAVTTTGKDPTFGGITWGSYTYTTDAVLVPYELLEDAFIDLPSYLAEAFAERNGKKLNYDCTLGVGGNGPKGFLAAAALGHTTASGQMTTIIYDDVVRLRFSVNEALRAGGRYMSNETIIVALRLIKDGQNRPLWTSGVDLAGPDRIDGYPASINYDMAASITASSKPLAYGNFKKYVVRKVGGRRFYRLTERYRENDQDGFVMFERADGNLITASSTNTPIKYMQMAAS